MQMALTKAAECIIKDVAAPPASVCPQHFVDVGTLCPAGDDNTGDWTVTGDGLGAGCCWV